MLKCHPHGLGFLQRGQMLCHVLCFYSCVCNLCLPPSLDFTNLDEKQKIKLLWPYTGRYCVIVVK